MVGLSDSKFINIWLFFSWWSMLFVECAPTHYHLISFQGVPQLWKRVGYCVGRVEKTGCCSTILLSSAETAISYFEPVNCEAELMVHCSVMCNCLYGSHSLVCLSGDDAVYCLSFGFPPQCGERSCCYSVTPLLGWCDLPFFVSVSRNWSVAKVCTERILTLEKPLSKLWA